MLDVVGHRLDRCDKEVRFHLDRNFSRAERVLPPHFFSRPIIRTWCDNVLCPALVDRSFAFVSERLLTI